MLFNVAIALMTTQRSTRGSIQLGKKILLKILTKSYNKKIKQHEEISTIVDASLIFKLDFQEDLQEDFFAMEMDPMVSDERGENKGKKKYFGWTV